MQESQNFYEILGVSHNATENEISRAHAKKRRECKNEDELFLITQAYETLRNKSERDDYDIELKYGDSINELLVELDNSKTSDEKKKCLQQLKKIYLVALSENETNINVLSELSDIEDLLGNKESAIAYLIQMLKCVDETEKLDVYSRLAELYKALKKVDEAIEYYQYIQKDDISRTEDVLQLVRLYYENKNDLDKALQVLYNCLSRVTNSIQKIKYSYEILRGIRVAGNNSKFVLEMSIYKKLNAFHSEKQDEHISNANEIFKCLFDALERNDFECCRKLEEIFLSFDIKIQEAQEKYEMYKQLLNIKEKGLIHEAVNLYLSRGEWTEKEEKEFGLLIIKQAEKIRNSLDTVKTQAPLVYEYFRHYAALEKIVDEYIGVSREYRIMAQDKEVNNHLRELLKYMILTFFIGLDAVREEGFRERDLFFENQSYEIIMQSVKRLATTYPECYEIFANGFGGVDEVARKYAPSSTSNIPTNLNTNSVMTSVNNKSQADSEDNKGCGYLIFFALVGFAIGAIGISFPPSILIFYFIYKILCYRQEKKENALGETEEVEILRREKKKARRNKIKKLLKYAAIIVAIIYGISAISSVFSSINKSLENNKSENYNIILTEEELEKLDDLDEKYEKKTDVDIYIIQVGSDYVEVFPEENYICLILRNRGSWGEYEVFTNCLNSEDSQELFDEVKELYESNNKDYKKCKKFYELAYKYSKKAIKIESSTMFETPEATIENPTTESQVVTTNKNVYADCSNMTSGEKVKYVANCYGCSEENILDITNEYLYPESDGYDDGWAKLAKTGVIGVYEHIHTYMYGGKLYYGGASDFVLVLYKNGVVEKYYPDFGLFPLEQQEINLSSTTEHTTKPIITTQPTTKPKQTTEPTKQEVSTTVNYGTPVMSWGEIDGFNIELAKEISKIDKDIFDYYDVKPEKYHNEGYVYLGEYNVVGLKRGGDIPKYYLRGIEKDEIFTHESFSNVEFFSYMSSPYGEVVIATKPENFSSKISSNSTVEDLSRLFGKKPYLTVDFGGTTDFATSEDAVGVVFTVDRKCVVFFFDKEGKMCDFVYFMESPYAIMSHIE